MAGAFMVVVRAARATSPHRPHACTLVVGTTVFAMALTYDAASEYVSWVPVALTSAIRRSSASMREGSGFTLRI